MAQDTFTSSDLVGDVLVTKIQGDLTELFAIATEVTNARDGEANLLAQIDALQASISTVTTEVTNARDGEANLLAQIDDLQADVLSVTIEVTNARDGESSLLDQIEALQASITALTVGTGNAVSANDSTPGYLNGKLVAGTSISFTEGNDGGDETLTIAVSKAMPTGDVVGTTDAQTLTNKTLTNPALVGVPTEDIFTITDAAAFEIDPGNGGQQGITLGASRTPKGTNFVNGQSVTLFVDDGTDYTLTWTDATWGGSGVVWKTDGGTAPTLNTTGYTAILLAKFGGQVYGWRCGDN